MDYANRKPKKKSPKNTRKKANNRNARGASKRDTGNRQVPWVVVIIAIVLIAAFTYGLVKINGSSSSVSEQHPTIQPPPEDLLPEKPEERWQYIEELESKEVEVDVPERELGPPKLMQCGSFRQQDDAEILRAEIAMAGLESQVRATQGDNGLWYRVILGPYETKRDAERDRHKLQRAKVFGCAIWNWNLD